MVKTGAGREGNRFLGVKGEIVGSPGTKELPAFPGSALKSLNLLQRGWGEALRQLPATFDYLESANTLCPLREGVADNYIALKRKKKRKCSWVAPSRAGVVLGAGVGGYGGKRNLTSGNCDCSRQTLVFLFILGFISLLSYTKNLHHDLHCVFQN